MEPTKVLIILFLSLMIPGSFSATFTFTNRCPFTVWPGVLTSAGKPQYPTTGFELRPGASQSQNAPANWEGRFWARTGCNGQFTCETGTCRPSLGCSGAGGAPPVTLAEFRLNGHGGQDFYDISNVDGFNIPISIRPDRGCRSASCPTNINSLCPAELSVRGSGGNTVGCKSACLAFNKPHFCCTGEFASGPDKCKPTDYSRLFKNACPQAYSYAYDDASSTFTCGAGANYAIIFCPPGNSYLASVVSPYEDA